MNVISPICFSVRRACALVSHLHIVGITRHRRIRVIFEPEVVDKLVTWDVRFWPSRRPRPTTELFRRDLRAKESVGELLAKRRTRRLPKQHTTKHKRRLSRVVVVLLSAESPIEREVKMSLEKPYAVRRVSSGSRGYARRVENTRESLPKMCWRFKTDIRSEFGQRNARKDGPEKKTSYTSKNRLNRKPSARQAEHVSFSCLNDRTFCFIGIIDDGTKANFRNADRTRGVFLPRPSVLPTCRNRPVTHDRRTEGKRFYTGPEDK